VLAALRGPDESYKRAAEAAPALIETKAAALRDKAAERI
jgi:hypothetical protein